MVVGSSPTVAAFTPGALGAFSETVIITSDRDAAMAQKGVGAEKTVFEGILEALSDKHSELHISLQGMSGWFPCLGGGVECNGHVTLSAHVRDITEDEKKASASRNVALMSK